MSSSESIFKAIFSLLVITNTFGNTLVILVILRNRCMSTPMNYLLLNLAVADLMFGVFMVPPFILENTFDHPNGLSGDILCKIITTGNLAWVGAFASVFSLVVIAFERYYAVVKPLSIRHMFTIEKLQIILPVCWTIAVVHNIPQFVADHFDEDLHICMKAWPAPWFPKFHSLLSIFAGAILPGVIMAVLYSKVIYQLWFKGNIENNVTVQAVRKARKKITKTMLIVSAIYVFCWFPDLVMYTLANFLPKQFPYDSPVVTAAICLAVLNSSINPVIYVLQYKKFRKELRKMICCGRKGFFNLVRLRTDRYNPAARRVEMGNLSSNETLDGLKSCAIVASVSQK